MHPFKHTIYSALVVLLSFTACKKEDVTPETPTAAKAVLIFNCWDKIVNSDERERCLLFPTLNFDAFPQR